MDCLKNLECLIRLFLKFEAVFFNCKKECFVLGGSFVDGIFYENLGQLWWFLFFLLRCFVLWFFYGYILFSLICGFFQRICYPILYIFCIIFDACLFFPSEIQTNTRKVSFPLGSWAVFLDQTSLCPFKN